MTPPMTPDFKPDAPGVIRCTALSAADLCADWTQQDKGWWTARILIGSVKRYMGVCKERDGRWHSYVNKDTLQSAPGFRTMKLAMADAETRAKSANVQTHTPHERP